MKLNYNRIDFIIAFFAYVSKYKEWSFGILGGPSYKEVGRAAEEG
jgi:hypothetical protein